MKLGVVLAVLGAIGVAFGATQAPWFSPELLKDGIYAKDLLVGPYVLGAAGAGALFVLLALILHRKMLAVGSIASAFVIGAALLVSFFFLDKVLPESVSADLVEKLMAQRLVVDNGFWFSLGGFALLTIGSFSAVGAVHTWGSRTRFLRVSLLWNGAAVKSQMMTEPRDVEVGRDAHTGIVVPSETIQPRFKMFKAHGITGDYELNLVPGLVGAVQVGGKRMTAEEAYASGAPAGGNVKHLRIGKEDWGKLDFGDLSVFFQFVRPGLPGGGLGRFMLDTWVLASMSVSVLAVLGAIAYLCWAYDPQFDAYQLKKPVVKVWTVDPSLLEKEEEKKEEDEGKEEDTTAKKAEGDEGEFGDPDIPPEIKSKVPKMDGKMVSKIDPKRVGLVDILSSNKLQAMSAMSNILSANTSALSNKMAVAMAGAGSEFVLGHGSGGMGFKGTGTGGGGTDGFGRIHGLGKIDTGGGTGVAAKLGTKRAGKVGKINIGSGQSTGFCEKGDIANVVRRRASAIRACYEQRLQVNNNLSGKLTARWTIGLDGRVQVASLAGTTLSDGSVGECVLRVIRRMTFKKPEGGVCIVQWPFVFNPGQ